MAYTTINKHTAHFNTKLYTGGSGDTAHTGVGFQPDLVWIKERTRARNHAWFDAIRGSRRWIGSNSNGAEDYNSGAYLASLDSDGFTTTDTDVVGKNGYTYASWNWKANGAGSANTAGTINSTVSVNTTAGFSIVKYTGNGVANATIGHGLNDTIACIILKNLSDSENWWVYHKGLSDPATKAIILNSTAAEFSPGTSAFYPTNFSNTLFSVKNDNASNSNGDNYIAYVFAEKTGYSKFGSYTGNGSAEGTFIYTGFKPSFVMIKEISSSGYQWTIEDNKRSTYNGASSMKWLFAESNGVETTESTWDLLSNGFKQRANHSYVNHSGTHIYMAFGQSLVGSNNVPCTAR